MILIDIDSYLVLMIIIISINLVLCNNIWHVNMNVCDPE